MKKYWSVFRISFQQEFVYRVNFIMWRVRNVLQILMLFFLWDTLYSSPDRIIFGYDREKILTYVFGIVIVRAFVLSARAVDVAGEISRGEILNYLVKPLNYFKYWLTRDIASKTLNLIFAFLEITLLYFLIKPQFFFQTEFIYLAFFTIAIVLAVLIYFLLLFIVNSVTFWIPEAGWGVQFLITVIAIEFLSGALFPLDILPTVIQTAISYTPFPYLIFFPIQIYLGKLSTLQAIKGLSISLIWLLFLFSSLTHIWKKGLKVYEAYGR